jgi:hypothetical protein
MEGLFLWSLKIEKKDSLSWIYYHSVIDNRVMIKIMLKRRVRGYSCKKKGLAYEQPLANGLHFIEAIFNGEVQTQGLMVQK